MNLLCPIDLKISLHKEFEVLEFRKLDNRSVEFKVKCKKTSFEKIISIVKYNRQIPIKEKSEIVLSEHILFYHVVIKGYIYKIATFKELKHVLKHILKEVL